MDNGTEAIVLSFDYVSGKGIFSKVLYGCQIVLLAHIRARSFGAN